MKFSSVTSVIPENFSKNVTQNYNHLSDKFYDNYTTLSTNLSDKLNDYPRFSSGLTTTKSTIQTTISNGTNYVYSLPTSIGSTVSSYTSMFQPVDAEEREVTRTPPNDNLNEGVIPLDESRLELINHILDIYCCKATKECFKHYHEDVILEDPLLYSTGLASLKAQFYGMQKLFAKSTTESYKILENTAYTLKFDLSQKYTLPIVGRAFVQNCQVILTFTDSKIIKHTDLWNGKDFNKEGVLPFRKGIAKLVSVLVSVPEN